MMAHIHQHQQDQHSNLVAGHYQEEVQYQVQHIHLEQVMEL